MFLIYHHIHHCSTNSYKKKDQKGRRLKKARDRLFLEILQKNILTWFYNNISAVYSLPFSLSCSFLYIHFLNSETFIPLFFLPTFKTGCHFLKHNTFLFVKLIQSCEQSFYGTPRNPV